MRNLFLIMTLFTSYYNCYSQMLKKEYHKNGKILRQYEVDKDSLNNGFDIYYFESGKISEKKFWKHGKLSDSLFTYDEKGKIISKGFINKNGLLKLYKNNTLYYEGLLDRDKLKGLVVYFKDNDVILSKFFSNAEENGFGIVLDDKSLKPKFIYEIKNDIKNGVLIDFYENGMIKSFRTKPISSANAQYFEFHSNGTLKIIGHKNNGLFNDYVYYLNEKGNIEKRVFYKNGEAIFEE